MNDRERDVNPVLLMALEAARRRNLDKDALIETLLARVKELEDNEVLWEAMKRGVSVRIGDLEARVASLTRERDAARTALRPFADVADSFLGTISHRRLWADYPLTIGDFREAARIVNAAAAPTDDGGA